LQVDVAAEFTLSGGWQFADVESDLEDIVGEYLRELSESWAQTENIIVWAAQIESRLLNEPRGRVVDISGLRLNGGVVGRNVTLAADEIPLRGAVVHD
jgi:hypothetical protein